MRQFGLLIDAFLPRWRRSSAMSAKLEGVLLRCIFALPTYGSSRARHRGMALEWFSAKRPNFHFSRIRCPLKTMFTEARISGLLPCRSRYICKAEDINRGMNGNLYAKWEKPSSFSVSTPQHCRMLHEQVFIATCQWCPAFF